MKSFILFAKIVFFLGVFGFILIGCKDNSKNDKATNKTDAYATIQLEDGQTIDLEVKRQKGFLSSPTNFTANMTDYGLVIMLRLDTNDQDIKEKEYENPQADLAIMNVNKDGPLDETYRSYFTNEDGNEGETKLTLTSIAEDHSEGTFRGILYSTNHKKAVIEGKFITKRKKKK